MRQNDLLDRTFNFAVAVLKFLRTIESLPESNLIRYQLGKSCTSVGEIMKNHKQVIQKLIFSIKLKFH